MHALTGFRPSTFADYLERLRTDARLTQRGVAPPPHPSMLRQLARGLATSGSGRVDGARAEALYLDLMHSAGYVPAPGGPSPDAVFRDQLVFRLGEDATRMELLIGKLRGRPERDRRAVFAVAETLLNYL